MTMTTKPAMPSDAELVAYLDGELSPADSVRIAQSVAADPKLGARLDLMMKGARPFRQAFEPLLAQAPADRLDSMLDAVLQRPAQPAGRVMSLVRQHRLAAVAASFALMVAGSSLDRLVVSPLLATVSPVDAQADWRRAVAQYLSLYTTETLSIIPAGTAQRRELASLGQKLGLDMTDTLVSLPDLTLKRSEMLDYDGRPLGFMAYLDPVAGPLALCIMTGVAGDTMPRVEHRRGLGVVYWSQHNRGFMLIGHAGDARLQALAATVADRFAAAAPLRQGEDRG
ncbi:anti-sigma factor family protein [Lichenifustis flavocetrariae]|uniref:Anti-sigma factor n=1 Tax=Lichenifustis flavocetrariae TaxID=2949735 RepID=A0AA42CQN2_9HYPH|nr:anti-sigma factor [Lichenifustis flavocetrariae]MCW6511612.1 anti-sigma factor [Lichenifustis flavocetrariae]